MQSENKNGIYSSLKFHKNTIADVKMQLSWWPDKRHEKIRWSLRVSLALANFSSFSRSFNHRSKHSTACLLAFRTLLTNSCHQISSNFSGLCQQLYNCTFPNNLWSFTQESAFNTIQRLCRVKAKTDSTGAANLRQTQNPRCCCCNDMRYANRCKSSDPPERHQMQTLIRGAEPPDRSKTF